MPALRWTAGLSAQSVGGVNVNNREQWDYFECPLGCGRFVYRPRTKKLRRETD